MAKRDVDDHYGSLQPGEAPPLLAKLLFEHNGPFSRSAIEPSEDERWLADLLWKHQGRGNPISIKTICSARREHWINHRPLDEREVKGLVEKLRRDHRVPIGALRTNPGGYFIMRDIEDERAGMGSYLSQIFTSLRSRRAMLSREYLREMAGQIRMALEGTEE